MNVNPNKYAVYQGCIIVNISEEKQRIKGVTWVKCAYLEAHKSALVTRHIKLTPSQQQEHIRLFDSEKLTYSYFPLIDLYRVRSKG